MADDSSTARGQATVVLGALALVLLQVAAPEPLQVSALLRALTAPGDGASDPLVAVIGGVRVVALVLGWYSVVVVALALVVRRVGGWRARRLLGRLVVPPLRRLVVGVTGLALLSAPAPATAESDLVVDLRVPPGIATPWLPPDRHAASTDAGSVSASGLAGQGSRVRPLPRDGVLWLSPGGSPPAIARPADRLATPTAVHVVAPGESFWSIAAGHLAAHGRPTDERRVATYWWRLIAANEDRLVVAGDPDLLFPGQELVLAPLPAAVSGDAQPGEDG